MGKGKHGNKEAKKPERAPPLPTPAPELATAAGFTPGARALASLRKKKW